MVDPKSVFLLTNGTSVGNPKPPLDMAAGGRMTPALFTSLGATCQPGCVVGSRYT